MCEKRESERDREIEGERVSAREEERKRKREMTDLCERVEEGESRMGTKERDVS